jgi:hypothetical protein
MACMGPAGRVQDIVERMAAYTERIKGLGVGCDTPSGQYQPSCWMTARGRWLAGSKDSGEWLSLVNINWSMMVLCARQTMTP